MAGNRITEKFQYKTDIITSYDGHEQRIQTRQHPRHLLSYDYTSMDYMQAQWLRGLGRMRQSDAYYVPMWHTPVYLTQSHVGGRALYIDTECMYSLDDCEWIEIFVKDDVNQGNINIVRQVRTYLDGIIGLREGIDRRLDKLNTWIFPLKKCSVQPTAGLNYIYSNGSYLTHNFEDLLVKPANLHIPDKYISSYEEYEGMNRWGLPETLNNRLMLIIEPQWVSDTSVALSIDKAVNRLDNETGGFVYDLKNTKSYDIHTLELSLMNKKQINNMIRFFKSVKGRYKSFYCPTWVNDIQVCRDITPESNAIYTDWKKISQYYLSNKRSKKLILFTKDWRSYIVDILAYSSEKIGDITYGKIILSSSAGAYMPLSNILMVSYLNLVRFDSDELQLNYESNIVANTTLIMREVDDV